MKALLFLFMLCLPVLALDDSLRTLNLNSLEFEFYPCTINKPIITLEFAALKKCTNTLMVIKHKDVKYYWKNKSELFRGKTSLGCYKFLCIRWLFGYQFFYY